MIPDWIEPVAEEAEASETDLPESQEADTSQEIQRPAFSAEDERRMELFIKQQVEQQMSSLEELRKEMGRELENMRKEFGRQSEEISRQRFEAEHKEGTAQALLAAVEKASSDVSQREAATAVREEKLRALEAAYESRQKVQEETLSQHIASKQAICEEEIARRKIEAETELSDSIAEQRRAAGEEITRCLSKAREEGFQNLEEALQREWAARLKLLEEELRQKRLEAEKGLELEQKQHDQRKEALDSRAKELESREKELSQREQNVAFQEARINSRERQIEDRETQISESVQQAVAERQQTMDKQLAFARAEADRLRGLLGDAEASLSAYKDFQNVWGDNPDAFHEKITRMQQELDKKAQELARRPPESLTAEYETKKKEFDALMTKYQLLLAEKSRFDSTEKEITGLRKENEDLQEQVRELEFEKKDYQGRYEGYRKKLERYVHPENAPQLYDERVAEIEQPYLRDIPHQAEGTMQPDDEIKWLDGISKSCDSYGISFPKRILYAFHTSLKIADWSSITVLAGVSGTGKSELPRLYSIFGGINFISVPVQPNWDSQESMLGYFNSIDNRFDAQPLLRFLVQCTSRRKNVGLDENDPASGECVPDAEPYPLGKYVAIVLLDEMNLAHVEHYFADFLSKLESRRGLGRGKEPEIEVKLGAGCEPYHLRLKRNILFVGTMNQDETTKSLSDKVLDRGIMIHFPRPAFLNSREEMGNLDKSRTSTLLEYKTWYGWCRRKTQFSTDALRSEILRYKRIVEAINDQLEMSGRAVGHRVWQSIEYYIANYPTVISNMVTEEGELPPKLSAAMQDAFEDQLVQKVMPKLRGIETRGEGGRQLEAIKQILQDEGFDNLLEDYDNACSRGYGQFSWNSAHYLENEGNVDDNP